MPPDSRLPLSVAIICKNNESTIGRTVASVGAIARQIVAVDSGSTDATPRILRDAGAEVIEHEWLGFGRQKNIAMEHCREPWTLFLDSDESVEPELAASIRAALSGARDDIAGYEINRKIFYAGKLLHHAWQPEWRLRLVRTGWARWSDDHVHESLELSPEHAAKRIERLRGDLRHDAIPNVTEHLRKQIEYARLGAADYAARGRRGSVTSLIVSPVTAWLKQLVMRQAWRDGWRGCAAASISACATMMKHLALLELTRAAPGAQEPDHGE